MTWFMLLMIFLLGTCFGSFVNMLVYRTAVSYELKKRKFEVKDEKRSFCDGCGKPLRWSDNIPIVSWVFLGGKTRCCKKKLPLAYPIVELSGGLLFVFLWLVGGWQKQVLDGMEFTNWIELVAVTLLAAMLLFAVVFDLYYMILPDFSTLILFCLALVLTIIKGYELPNHLIASVGAGGFLGGLYLLTKGKGIGFGDVKWALFMGMLLGGWKTIVAFYVAFVVGAIVGATLMLMGKAKGKTAIPFGPFLALGTVIAWSWGEVVIDFFKTWFF